MKKTRIHIERAKHELTQQELANCVGTSRQTINEIEKGSAPSVTLALKIANFFNTTIEYLFKY